MTEKIIIRQKHQIICDISPFGRNLHITEHPSGFVRRNRLLWTELKLIQEGNVGFRFLVVFAFQEFKRACF